jgi:integrase
MATIKLFIQSKQDAANIYIRLRAGVKIDAKAPTKYVINPNEWSTSKEQPKNLRTESQKTLNANLLKLKSDLLDHYNACVGKEVIDSKWLVRFLNPPETVSAVPTGLVPYFKFYEEQQKNLVGSSTYKRNNVYMRLVERFEKASRTQYYIKDVGIDFKLKFEGYCAGQNYSHNTVARTIKFIKTLCYHARSNRIETHYQLNSIKVRLKKTLKVFLPPSEIALIKEVALDLDYLENARQWLIISCETGQRVSDFMRFEKKMIRYEKEKPLIEFTQTKTNKIMAIPLSPTVVEILAKHKGNFPRKISDQKYNEYIKDVCELAGITEIIPGSKLDKETNRKVSGKFPKYELITSHIGRRSFATNNYGRIPTPLLMNVTGHSTEKMFLEYIGKTETEKAHQLAEYF